MWELDKLFKSFFHFNKECGVAQTMVSDLLKAVLRGEFISLPSAHKKAKEHLKLNFLTKLVSWKIYIN